MEPAFDRTELDRAAELVHRVMPPRASFNFARHFGLLGLFTAALAVAGPRAGPGIGAQFALYGALHAVSLTLSPAGGARPSPARGLLFVAIAAMLSLSTALLGLRGLHRLTGFGALAGALIAACAGLGALAYGASIRGVPAAPFGAARRWSWRPIGATSLGCAAVAALSFSACREFHAASILWLVAPWWFAFSAGLWYATAADSPRMRS